MTFSRIPDQPFEVRLMRVYYEAKGPWAIQWQPPAAPTPAEDAATPTPASTLAPLPSPTLATSDPVVLEVQQLAQKFDAPFQQGPGWVHIVKETISTPSAGQTFPPPYLMNEQWVEVDAEGTILRYLWLDYNVARQLIQQSATVGDYSVNFTTGDSGFNRSGSYRFSVDTLTRDLSQAAQYENTHLTREEIPCDNGRPCLLITGWETFASPVQNPGETLAFTGGGRRVWIDMETGQQVKDQKFRLLEDGSEAVTSTSSYILVEKVDSPPEEILDALDRVIVP